LGALGQPDLVWPDQPGAALEDHFAILQHAQGDVLQGANPSPTDATTIAFSLNGNRYTVFEQRRHTDVLHQGLTVRVAGLGELQWPCTPLGEPHLSGLRP